VLRKQVSLVKEETLSATLEKATISISSFFPIPMQHWQLRKAGRKWKPHINPPPSSQSGVSGKEASLGSKKNRRE